jgi:hypothetical protein
VAGAQGVVIDLLIEQKNVSKVAEIYRSGSKVRFTVELSQANH